MTPRDDQSSPGTDRGMCRSRPRFPTTVTRMGARLPTPVTDNWDWQIRGACRGMDGGLFFSADAACGGAGRGHAGGVLLATRCPIGQARAVGGSAASYMPGPGLACAVVPA